MVQPKSLIPVPGLRRVGLERPEPNLFLHVGVWQAACPACGFILCESRTQARAEHRAARTSCPVCVEVA